MHELSYANRDTTGFALLDIVSESLHIISHRIKVAYEILIMIADTVLPYLGDKIIGYLL